MILCIILNCELSYEGGKFMRCYKYLFFIFIVLTLVSGCNTSKQSTNSNSSHSSINNEFIRINNIKKVFNTFFKILYAC